MESSTADTNYGTQYGMLTKPPVNGSADRIALMRFDLSPHPRQGRHLRRPHQRERRLRRQHRPGHGARRRARRSRATGTRPPSPTPPSRTSARPSAASCRPARRPPPPPTSPTSCGPAPAATSRSMSLGLTQDDAGTTARLVTVSSRESGRGAYLDVTLAPARPRPSRRHTSSRWRSAGSARPSSWARARRRRSR